jgi:hypothetical protein
MVKLNIIIDYESVVSRLNRDMDAKHFKDANSNQKKNSLLMKK